MEHNGNGHLENFLIVNRVEVLDTEGCSVCGREFSTNPVGEKALVLALGGGAIEHAATRELLLAAPGTLLVHLEVELATTLTRCRGTEHTRPILADQANLASRYQRRLPLYRTAHVSIPVDSLTPEQAVGAILQAAGLG